LSDKRASCGAAQRLLMASSTPQMTLSRSHKWMFAAGFMGLWGPLTIFSSHRTLLFVVYYQVRRR
jgi:hypothetical protein